MCYQGYGYPLMLFLEEGGVVTVCKINTQEPEETLDFDFCSTNVINKIILQSEGLREAFSELDMTSEVLQITMSPDKPYFRYLKAVQLQLTQFTPSPYLHICLGCRIFIIQVTRIFRTLESFYSYFILFQVKTLGRPRKINSLFKASQVMLVSRRVVQSPSS